MTDDTRSDADVRGDVLQALMLDTLVPSTIDAKVNDGEVALTGEAEFKFQRDEALEVAGNIRGVINVWDEVAIVGPPPVAGDVKDAISKAFDRSAKLDADALTVESSDGNGHRQGDSAVLGGARRGHRRRLGGARRAQRARPHPRLLLGARREERRREVRHSRRRFARARGRGAVRGFRTRSALSPIRRALAERRVQSSTTGGLSTWSPHWKTRGRR